MITKLPLIVQLVCGSDRSSSVCRSHFQAVFLPVILDDLFTYKSTLNSHFAEMTSMPGFEISWYFDGPFNASPIYLATKQTNIEFRR